MIDVMGRNVIFESIVNSAYGNISDLGKLTKGMYFLKISDKNNNIIYTQKVLKE